MASADLSPHPPIDSPRAARRVDGAQAAPAQRGDDATAAPPPTPTAEAPSNTPQVPAPEPTADAGVPAPAAGVTPAPAAHHNHVDQSAPAAAATFVAQPNRAEPAPAAHAHVDSDTVERAPSANARPDTGAPEFVSTSTPASAAPLPNAEAPRTAGAETVGQPPSATCMTEEDQAAVRTESPTPHAPAPTDVRTPAVEVPAVPDDASVPEDDWAVAPELPGSAGEHLLQQAYGTRTRAERFYNDQMCDRLNESMIEFVQRMEMAFIATADASGATDCSLRAGPPGFIQVLDDRHVAYPEYRGNGVLASLGNISENPNVGIMLIDFVRDRIGLHINGHAKIVDDDAMRAAFDDLPVETVRGRMPERWVLVEVDEAYIHCRKHIPGMQPADADQAWGSDDVKRKGGDYFGVRAGRKAAATDRAPQPVGTGARGAAAG